jgi:hypothetical protein
VCVPRSEGGPATTCSNNTMLTLLKVDMARKATVHGFRSAF